MVGLYCAVLGCNNNLAKCRNLGLRTTFHRFPLDSSLREVWTDSCNRGKDWKKPNVFMCSDHFTPSDFRHNEVKNENGRKRTQLVKGAVPSCNLPTSKYICCADGCKAAAPAVLVRRFPKEVTRRTELLSGIQRKQGLSVMDSYPCERHIALKQFLKDEVEKIAGDMDSEPDETDIVIFEVSTVGGKQNSTKLIEPRVKKRKVRFFLEGGESVKKIRSDIDVESTLEKVVEPECDYIRDEIFKSEKPSTLVNKLVNSNADVKKSLSVPAGSSSGTRPLPVLVKNGDTSQLMFLHHSAHLRAEPHASPKPRADSDTPRPGKRRGDVIEDKPDPSPKTTGDLLVDRLYRRIQELEERIVSQRDHHKMKMTEKEQKYTIRIKELNSRVKELKAEVLSFNKVHKNIFKKGLVRPVTQSLPKSPQSISREVHQILGRSFTSNQIKKIMNESEPIRWSNSELLNAYTLKHLSYGAYTFVRNHLKYPLPSPKYLARWLSKVEKQRLANQPITDIQQSPSESENGSEEELVGASAKSDSSCCEIILEDPSSSCGVDFEPDGEVDEEMEDGGHQNSEEILIIANPEGAGSSNTELSSQDQDPDNFEVYYALQSAKGSLSSPKIYVLKQTDEKTLEAVQIQESDVISGSENSA